MGESQRKLVTELLLMGPTLEPGLTTNASCFLNPLNSMNVIFDRVRPSEMDWGGE